MLKSISFIKKKKTNIHRDISQSVIIQGVKMIIREKARKEEPSNITYIYMYGCLSSHKLDSSELYLFKVS